MLPRLLPNVCGKQKVALNRMSPYSKEMNWKGRWT